METAILIIIFLGIITAYFATTRGRSPIAWFLIGGAFGLLGLIVLFVIPDLKVLNKTENDNI